MASEVNPIQSESFGSWYYNDAITGHIFLTPSIYLIDGSKRVVSKIEEKGCDAVLEVICRIVFCILTPLILLITAIATPIGLVVKGMGTCCYTPHHMAPLKPAETAIRSVRSATFSTSRKVPPLDLSRRSQSEGSTPVTRPPPPLLSYSPADLTQAMEALDKFESQLKEINFKKVDVERVKQIEADLVADRNIGQLLSIPPQKNSAERTAFQDFLDRFTHLKSTISYFLLLDKMAQALTSDGEYKVDGDGNCLFAAFCVHSELSGSLHDETVDTMRRQAMEWIERKYQTNETLQNHLLNSMIEHYTVKLEQLKDEENALKVILVDSSLSAHERSEREKRSTALPAEFEQLENDLFNLSTANGVAHGGNFFELVHYLVPSYIAEMRQPKKYAGMAELYALSCLHQVAIHVHAKNDSGAITSRPYLVFNDEFIDKPARHFSHTGKHYNPMPLIA